MIPRSALIGLLAAAAAASFPAAAAASIAPGMSLEQSAGTTAGSTVPTGFAINFKPRPLDSAEEPHARLPGRLSDQPPGRRGRVPGLAPPRTRRARSAPARSTGRRAARSGSIWSRRRPSPISPGWSWSIEGGGTSTGGITLTGSPSVAESLAFTGLPGGIGEMQFTLSGRLPSGCTTTPLVKIRPPPTSAPAARPARR